jgi:hypothetical protein
MFGVLWENSYKTQPIKLVWARSKAIILTEMGDYNLDEI